VPINAAERTETQRVADEIIALVRALDDFGGGRGDAAGLVMHGAFVRAFRRFVTIRQLAGAGAGEEAVMLARSLLSILARSFWVDAPTDPSERRRRFDSYKKRQLQDELAEAEGLAAIGLEMEVEADVGELRAQLAELATVPRLPPDAVLLKSLGLDVYYERLYRRGSGYLHFSLRTAIDELRSGAEVIALERPDPELSDDALSRAIFTYGLFLELSDKTVRHGLGAQVLEIVRASPAFELG
jgi:hypothetical protein